MVAPNLPQPDTLSKDPSLSLSCYEVGLPISDEPTLSLERLKAPSSGLVWSIVNPFTPSVNPVSPSIVCAGNSVINILLWSIQPLSAF